MRASSRLWVGCALLALAAIAGCGTGAGTDDADGGGTGGTSEDGTGGSSDGGTGGTSDGGTGGTSDGGTGGTSDGGTSGGGTSDGGTGGTSDGGTGGTSDGGTGGTSGGGTSGGGTGGSSDGGTSGGGTSSGGSGGTSDGGTSGGGTGGTSDGGMGGASDGGSGGSGGSSGGGSGGGPSPECEVPADCDAEDTECRIVTCEGNLCGFIYEDAETPLSQQTAGDCKVAQCDGVGEVEVVADSGDLPDDSWECTTDTCNGTQAVFTPKEVGTPCSEDDGSYCDADQFCVECTEDEQCSIGACIDGACETCGDGALSGDETDVDCGGTCSDCANGQVCSVGTDCVSGDCTGGFCIGAVTTFRVLRVGDGLASLNNGSTVAYLEERSLQDGALIGIIQLPTAANGAHKPFTLTGSSTSEGNLSRSANGSYLTVAGYAEVPGVAAVFGNTAFDVNRAVARIDHAGNVDTTTVLTAAFDGSNVRSATSSDGSGFWVSGSSAGLGTGGVHYVELGSTGASAQLTATPNSTRFSHVFGGQLYATSNTLPFANVFAVGTGLATTTGQTATSLPGMPTNAGPSPFSFVLLDWNPDVPGLDLLYVADDRSLAAGGGIQKWTFNGTGWTLSATFGASSGLTTGCRGLAAMAGEGSVVLLATTTESSQNDVLLLADVGATPIATAIATAPADTAYRGVALSPHAP